MNHIIKKLSAVALAALTLTAVAASASAYSVNTSNQNNLSLKSTHCYDGFQSTRALWKYYPELSSSYLSVPRTIKLNYVPENGAIIALLDESLSIKQAMEQGDRLTVLDKNGKNVIFEVGFENYANRPCIKKVADTLQEAVDIIYDDVNFKSMQKANDLGYMYYDFDVISYGYIPGLKITSVWKTLNTQITDFSEESGYITTTTNCTERTYVNTYFGTTYPSYSYYTLYVNYKGEKLRLAMLESDENFATDKYDYIVEHKKMTARTDGDYASDYWNNDFVCAKADGSTLNVYISTERTIRDGSSKSQRAKLYHDKYKYHFADDALALGFTKVVYYDNATTKSYGNVLTSFPLN